MYNLEKIKFILKQQLSDKRFYHSLCVMEMCEKLANYYNINIEEAKLVGLAHDIAKEMPSEEKIQYSKANNLPVDTIENSYPSLLHAKIGADICKKQFDFSDNMCSAISLHTTGGENMDILSKILFVSDAIGIDRNYPSVEYARNLAFENLDKCVLYILNFTISDCLEKNKPIHINTILARNYLLINQ